MRKRLLSLLMLSLPLLLVSCGSDKEEEPSSQVGVSATLSVENLSGEQTEVVSSGEDFYFCLTIQNHTEEVVELPQVMFLLGLHILKNHGLEFSDGETFKVHAADGTDMGIAHYGKLLEKENLVLEPHGELTLRTPWRNREEMKMEDDPLAPGEYYSRFNLYLNKDKDYIPTPVGVVFYVN